jgi:predicted ATPase
MLIILDCCDRVVDDAAILAENLPKGVRGVDILATSREPLRAESEVLYRLSPLEIPPAANENDGERCAALPGRSAFR